MKEMKIGYVCEVLHFLLRKRYGAPLVKLPIDLVDKDNEASLDLLCALFKHCKCKEDEERRMRKGGGGVIDLSLPQTATLTHCFGFMV